MAGGIPNYKLTYFPVRGRVEFIRYLFALADVPYEEELVNSDEWTSKKPSTPFGALPVLLINQDHTIGQSVAIGRYLAKRFGLYGRNALEQAKIDSYIDGCVDLYPKFAPYLEARLKGDKEAMVSARHYKEFKERQLTTFLERYKNFLRANQSGWFVGDRVSLADVYIGEFLDRLHTIFDPGLLDDHFELKQLVNRLHALPGIDKRIAERPTYML